MLIAPDPSDATSAPTPILASRLQPPFVTPGPPTLQQRGVSQILLLPAVSKGCVLCNGTLTFYTLPELSPAFGTTRVRNCNWIGGLDQNLDVGKGEEAAGSGHMMIGFKDRIQLVKVGESEKPRSVKNIDYAGSLAIARRGPIACVANAHSYALLDIDHVQKINLFPISSLDDVIEGTVGGRVESTLSGGGRRLSSTLSSSLLQGPTDDRGHGRSTSLGALVGNLGRRQQSPQTRARGVSNVDMPEQSTDEDPAEASLAPARPSPRPPRPLSTASMASITSNDKPLPQPPSDSGSTQSHSRQTSDIPRQPLLNPLVLTPRPNEYLLTTGTAYAEAGVGMFVNSDGDVFRSTLQFEQYPEALVLDGHGRDSPSPSPAMGDGDEGFVLALMKGSGNSHGQAGIEIQRWDIDDGEEASQRSWLSVPTSTSEASAAARSTGICKILTPHDMVIGEVSQRLRLTRLRINQSTTLTGSPASVDSSDSRTKESLEQVRRETELFESRTSAEGSGEADPPAKTMPKDWEVKRVQEEEQFAQRLAHSQGRVLMWSGDRIWWLVKNPLVMRLDAALALAGDQSKSETTALDRRKISQVLGGIRDREPATEAEYLSLGYIRQKASLLLFIDFVLGLSQRISIPVDERRAVGDALMEGGLDPRVIIAMMPILREEVVEGETGIWDSLRCPGRRRRHSIHYDDYESSCPSHGRATWTPQILSYGVAQKEGFREHPR